LTFRLLENRSTSGSSGRLAIRSPKNSKTRNPKGGLSKACIKRLLVQEHLDRLHEVEPRVGSFLALNEQVALEQASAVDRSIAAGKRLGPLAGIPLAIKVSTPHPHPDDVTV
jgi:hypothetical protein